MYDVKRQVENFFTVKIYFKSDYGGRLISAIRRIWDWADSKLLLEKDGEWTFRADLALNGAINNMRENHTVPSKVTDAVLTDSLNEHYSKRVGEALRQFEIFDPFRVECSLHANIDSALAGKEKLKESVKKKAVKKPSVSERDVGYDEDDDEEYQAPSEENQKCYHCNRPFSEHSFDVEYAKSSGFKRYACPYEYQDHHDPHWYDSGDEFFEVTCPHCDASSAEGNGFNLIETVTIRRVRHTDGDSIQEDESRDIEFDQYEYEDEDEDIEESCLECENCGADVTGDIDWVWS